MEMNYYLHRISHHWEVSKPLFDDNYLTIGWLKTVNSGLFEAAISKNEKEFDRIIKELYPGESLRGRWGLYRF